MIKHEGLHTHRLKREPLEKAFAEAWIEECERSRTLDFLMCTGDQLLPSTQEQATVAATVVQWLGSPFGFFFVGEVLRGEGYRIEKVKP